MLFSDDALELEVLGSTCEPVPRRLPGARVVILHAAGDGIQVVELAALAELPDVEDLATALRPIASRVEETAFGGEKELRQPYFFLTSHRRVQVCARRSRVSSGEVLELCGLGH